MTKMHIAAMLIAGFSFASGAYGTACAQSANEITIKDFMYAPMQLTVKAGDTVIWKNMDEEPHTIVSLDGAFRSMALDQNDTFSMVFAKPGTYRYICSIHPQMTASVVVQ